MNQRTKYILSIFCLFQVLEWIVKQKTESLIEEVTDAILEELIKEHEYVAVYFRGDCANNKEVDCDEILADLETIDEDLDEIGIMLVTTKDNQVAIDNGKLSFIKFQFSKPYLSSFLCSLRVERGRVANHWVF